MILFWRLHWLWWCCVLHSNATMAAAGEEETTASYRKILPEMRESVKFSNPKYSSILRGTEADSRRVGADIVKKSNDHLEKQTAPNSISRVPPQQSHTNHSTKLLDQQTHDDDDDDDVNVNASRNARDLAYDTIIVNGTTPTPTPTPTPTTTTTTTTTTTQRDTTLKYDTVYSANNANANASASAVHNSNTAVNTTSVLNNSTTENHSLTGGVSINKSIAKSNAGTSVSTASPTVLKNPKDNENKTKIDSNSTFSKKVTVNLKIKNTTLENIDKSESFNVTRLENSTTNYIGDRWNSSEMSHNYNVTEDNSKNITLLTGLAEDDFNNETKISSTSRRTMAESAPLSTLNIALITVAALAVLSTLSVVAMLSVMLYRRYHWNKPQTLSDKCSNADSTGYIDDSTLKENSEEMYSLDNDSFLNSLEAMTIQNYWAGSIRHTKL